jgi:hypothetical protein
MKILEELKPKRSILTEEDSDEENSKKIKNSFQN